MNITTKFDLGQTVYKITLLSPPKWTPCDVCQRGYIDLKGSRYPCPKCMGREGKQTYEPQQWVIDGPLTVGRVGVELYRDTSQDVRAYMCDETGVGSGTVYKERDLFATRLEAESECAKRNAALVACGARR